MTYHQFPYYHNWQNDSLDHSWNIWLLIIIVYVIWMVITLIDVTSDLAMSKIKFRFKCSSNEYIKWYHNCIMSNPSLLSLCSFFFWFIFASFLYFLLSRIQTSPSSRATDYSKNSQYNLSMKSFSIPTHFYFCNMNYL